jgi:hypothetical protein
VCTAGPAADADGLFARYGQLIRDEADGRLLCHLCGRWFTFLGAHAGVFPQPLAPSSPSVRL